ncbi:MULTISPECIES: hypothetical protein [unclassified Rhizobium]|uniref:hypothetical protein n=1 Tax=unclassified Rhizobium TaxID=2613769 RepID=UPI001785B42D|nr:MULTISPECIES: hypothetical protein [unclassified Rhizobium]MBD8685994.1 hypothetical protein [Rhizobium sp. CFBP 13644]MBD8690333.1 hypothetical protein [Rhizobium sp. CFBP 13717]
MTITTDIISPQNVSPVYEEGDFRRQFYNAFLPKLATEYILSPAPLFHGFKDALLASLLAWMLHPYDSKLRKSVAKASIMRTVMNAEKWAKKHSPTAQATDTLARLRLTPQFTAELYFGVGGMSAAFWLSSSESVQQDLVSRTKSVMNAVEIMQIMHFVQANQPSRKKATIAGAISAIHKIWTYHPEIYISRSFTPYEERTLKEAWSDHDISITYLYGAANTKIYDGRSLLEALLSGWVSTDSKADWVEKWLAHSTYALSILSQYHNQKLYKKAASRAPSCPSEAFPVKEISEKEKHIIMQTFQMNQLHTG